jgi:putative beta-lysine N-acetyltransferase
MYDTITKIGNSLIQHGPNNNRIYLLKLNPLDYPSIVHQLEDMAQKNKYTKIFAKLPADFSMNFLQNGYKKEAEIPKFFNGKTDVYFVSKFLDPDRSIIDEQTKIQIDTNIKIACAKQGSTRIPALKSHFQLRKLKEIDIPALSKIYRRVFGSYPFPIFDTAYLKKTMNENVIYFGVFADDRLVAVSSAEMDVKAKNAEMTDFATDPEYAGNSFALILLSKMEQAMQKHEMKLLYTIARAFSIPMNITFARMNYSYAGTLINNTDIAGKIESMNIWYKAL